MSGEARSDGDESVAGEATVSMRAAAARAASSAVCAAATVTSDNFSAAARSARKSYTHVHDEENLR